MSKPLVAVVLAAGAGTRMKSSLPKVLHPLCGRPLLEWVVRAAAGAGPEEICVVVGHGAGAVTDHLTTLDVGVPVRTVLQRDQLGTGDAAACALASMQPGERDVLLLPGDMPLVTSETLASMVSLHTDDATAVTMLTAVFDDPTGYGRVVREIGGGVSRVVEEADCTREQALIDEVAVSTYVFDEPRLRAEVARLGTDNAQGEVYLTDVVAALFPDVDTVTVDADEVHGINDRAQLAATETLARRRINEAWMRAGVTMRDPSTAYVDAGVELEADVTLLPDVVLEGATTVRSGSVVGPGVRLVDADIGRDVTLSYCVVRESSLADGSDCGPYASLRAGCVVEEGAHVGTFVEAKKSVIGPGSKVPHLSYVGDAVLGADVNLGANTITCNWDGVDKHATKVGAGVRTGSGTLLVAPLEVGDDAYTGAGAVVTHDVPPGALAKGMPARNVEG
ncbi:MAG: bifunctional UDP-N-acetylglucosamine diphosphorylase/glucosamine-1-phosphate N-acetyltransferase GlmU, partial [Acidimicrobiia bacterium]|nr:bifunctional UDP-N-acetylglucosamine diphosphorylase/glucosamine-1-phosphate N-acetyltransferase GlmU [Acidimicrobiia bacterium]